MPRSVANVALNKQTRQSSVYADPAGPRRGFQASGGANNGDRGGLYGFHTLLEPAPWWIVDLGAQYRLYEIRIYNRCDSEAMAARASQLDVSVSMDGVFWVTAYSHESDTAFGLDSLPLVVTVEQALPLRYVKAHLRNTGCLHLKEVEVYGEPFTFNLDVEPPALPPLPGVGAISPTRKVIHLRPMGRLGNRMLQFMAAVGLQDLVPGAVLSNPGIPEWGFGGDTVEVLPDDSVQEIFRTPDFNRADLAARMNSGALSYLILEDYLQNISFYPDPERFRGVFKPPDAGVQDLPTFSPDEIVFNIRADELLAGVFHYPLVPAGFYRSIAALTGLRPVLMGQVEPGLYMDSLRQALPGARVVSSQGPMRDFQMLRSASHIVPSVSTFSWLGAWLSHAETIHLPVFGFYHPSLISEVDLLPLQDPRYRFYLLPQLYGSPEQSALECHRKMGDDWPLIPGEQLAFLQRHAPFVPDDPAMMVAVDTVWYAQEYLDAAREIAQGWYAHPQHHYHAIGRHRGYKPRPPDDTAVSSSV